MKEWQHMFEGFCGSQRSRPLFSSSSSSSCKVVDNSQKQQELIIDWSSSDEDAAKPNTSITSSSVIVRLNFDSCVQKSSGLSKASVSRDVTVVEEAEGSKSPVLHWKHRNIVQHLSDDVFEEQDEAPRSPILEAKRRLSPVIRRKRKTLNLELEPRTPEKVQIDEAALSSIPSSPVITVKRRRPPPRSKVAKVRIVEVDSQPVQVVEQEKEVVQILDSSQHSPAAIDNSTINLIQSPIIKSRKKKVTRSKKQLPVIKKTEVFQIIDESQEKRVEYAREVDIESISSQDIIAAKSSAPPCIQSVSSVSDAHLTQLQSSGNSRDQSQNLTDAPPLDPSQMPRKKPPKHGLLERLTKIKNRQRSLLRMWHHERQSGSKQIKGLTLQILGISSYGAKVVAQGKFTKSMQRVLILFDQEQIRRENIKAKDFIKIYPPWQSFDSSKIGVPIIMSLNLFEKVDQPLDFFGFDASQDTSSLKEFSCQCLEDPSIEPRDCTTMLPKKGQELFDTLLKPCCTTSGSKLRAVEELESTNPDASDEASQNQLFTIADAIEIYSKKTNIPLQLRLACQRIFVSKKVRKKVNLPTSSQASQLFEEVWVMLGQDANEMLCFVELKGDFRHKVKEGDSFLIKGLSLTKRLEISGKSEVLGLLATFSSEGKQIMSIYKFSTSRGSIVEKSVDVQPWTPPILSKLCFVHSNTNDRLSLPMKFLAHEGNRLYCTDTYCLKQVVPYLIIPIRPQTSVSKLMPGTVIFLQNLTCTRGEISTDEFTSISNIEEPLTTLQEVESTNSSPVREWVKKKLGNIIEGLKALKPRIPNLSNQIEKNQLVLLHGTICEVDEENSYSWPVCSKCNSEFLQDLPDGVMCCSICRSEGPFSNRVALSAFLIPSKEFCLSNSNPKVLVKFLQDTVAKLLPDWDENKEYGLDAVLGQEVGPIMCTIEFGKTANLCQVPYEFDK